MLLLGCPQSDQTQMTNNEQQISGNLTKESDNPAQPDKPEIEETWTNPNRQIETKFVRLKDEYTIDSGLYLENNRAIVEGYFPRFGTDFRVSPLGLINLETALISPLDLPSDCYRANDTNQPNSLLKLTKAKGANTAIAQLKTELLEKENNKHILKTRMFEIKSNGLFSEIKTPDNAVLVDTIAPNWYLYSIADWYKLEENGAFIPQFANLDEGLSRFLIVENETIKTEFVAPMRGAVNPSGTLGAFIFPTYQRPELIGLNLFYADLTQKRIRLKPFVKDANPKRIVKPKLSDAEANDVLGIKEFLFTWIDNETIIVHSIGSENSSNEGQNAFKICKIKLNDYVEEIANMAYTPIYDNNSQTLCELSISGKTDPPVFQANFVNLYTKNLRRYLFPINEYEYITPLFFLGTDTIVFNGDPTMEASKKYTEDKKSNAITGLVYLKLLPAS